METRKDLDGRAIGLMLILCQIWGFQQVVLKATALEMAPLLQIALRSGVAALLVGGLVLWRGPRIAIEAGTWRPGLLAGVLFAVEFLLVGEGLRHTTASHLVVFLYTAPIFVALGLHWLRPAERLGALRWLGILLAFAGIVVTFWGRSPEVVSGNPTAMLWGDSLALLAGMAWAATTLVVRCSRLAQVSATETLLYQLVVGFVLLLAAAVASDQTGIRPTPLLWGSLLFQSLVVSFASYLAWFWLLRHYWASRLGVFSFLTPLFGIAFGVGLLDEPVETSFLIGALLVLAGVVLVSGDDGWNALRSWLARPGDNARAVASRGDAPNAGYPVAATDCRSRRTHPRVASLRRSAGRNRRPSSE